MQIMYNTANSAFSACDVAVSIEECKLAQIYRYIREKFL
jgi:hypothetical protein